jgi:hypothetical protein
VRIDFLSTADGALLCRMEGPATPYGKVLRMPAAAYTCGTSFSTSAEITSLRTLNDGVEFHWVANLGAGCIERGRSAAVKQ